MSTKFILHPGLYVRDALTLPNSFNVFQYLNGSVSVDYAGAQLELEDYLYMYIAND